MTQECTLTGRITRLAVFTVPEFGTRASFIIECAGRRPTVCGIAGDFAREFIAHYGEGDAVALKGVHESRPSTAAAKTPWAGRLRVLDVRVAKHALIAA